MMIDIKKHRHLQWVVALKTMLNREYWNKANSVEFFAFVVKGAIIVPGLLFGIEIWWFYIFALISSIALIWSSTVKTIPTLIWFNILWSALAIIFLVRYWYA
jgi:hypothetical protein